MTLRLHNKKIIMLYVLFLCPFISSAQNEQAVGVGWGYAPVANAIFWPSGYPDGPEYRWRISSPGSLSVQFDVVRKSWLTSSFILDAAYLNAVYDGPKITNIYDRTIVSALHMWKFSYLNRESWQLYSSAGIGIMWGSNRHRGVEGADLKVLPAFQLVPVGVRYGRRYCVFAETEIGMSQLGLRLGVCYRFNTL